MSDPAVDTVETIRAYINDLLESLESRIDEEYQHRLDRYSDILDSTIEDLKGGVMTAEEAVETMGHVLLSLRSDLVSTGYQLKAETAEAYHEGIMMLLRVLGLALRGGL